MPIFRFDLKKMLEDFSEKQNHRGSAAQIFLASWLKNLSNRYVYIRLFSPFTGKRGQLGKSCNFRK